MIDDPTTIPLEPPPPAEPSDFRRIFMGRDGLRAGWSLLIFIALFVAIFSCIRVVTHTLHLPTGSSVQTPSGVSPLMLVAECLPFLVTLLVTWIMSRIEGRPNSVYGLGGSNRLVRFLAGLGWGVTCLSLLILTLWKTGYLIFEGRLLFGGEVVRWGAFWLLNFLVVGLLEEYLTRGYIQYTLSRGLAGLYRWTTKTRHGAALGFWSSAIILSFLFGLGHGTNPGESPIGLLSAGLAAMVFCFSLWRTGSLWWAIGFHAAWDWAQSFLYGVADSGMMVQHHLLATRPVGKIILSGGATGPEGSIFVVTVLCLAGLIILLTLPPGRYSLPAEPDEVEAFGTEQSAPAGGVEKA